MKDKEVVSDEICWKCENSVAWGSGRYLNRIPSMDSKDIRKENGVKGKYLCYECWLILHPEFQLE